MPAKKKTETVEEVVQISPLKRKKVKIKIIGDSPLIVHAWSEKAKKMILDTNTGNKKGKKKDPKNPVEEFIDSMYWLEGRPEEKTEEGFEEAIKNGARFGFPVTALKQAAISAAYRLGWVKYKTELKGVFFLNGLEGTDIVEINSDLPIMREDMVRVGMGSADIRYRGEFQNWSTELELEIIENCGYSLESIINIINAGGTICGIGEWRPEKDGQFGLFHVAESE